MSADEFVVLIFLGGLALMLWAYWVAAARNLATFGRNRRVRRGLLFMPLLCAAILCIVLMGFAAHDVRDAPIYLLFYLVMGAAWLAAMVRLMTLLGLSVRDDVIERDNPAAALALGGALPALTFCFAGGNIGDGPGWWVVVFSAALATGAMFFLWILACQFSGWADRLTIDRDPSSGLRAAGFFLGSGLILGRAVAGNWHSLDLTIMEFVSLAWLVLPLLLAASVIERRAATRAGSEAIRPGVKPVLSTSGGVASACYVAWGIAVVVWAGVWK